MSARRQYKRSVNVTWGAASEVKPAELEVPAFNPSIGNLDDDGVRISFDATRTLAGEPDRAKVELWNLAKSTAASIAADHEKLIANQKAVINSGLFDELLTSALSELQDSHVVQLSAGYGGRPELIFQGEYTDVRSRERRGFSDVVTVMELGDSVSSLRDGFIGQPLGLGVNIPQFIAEFTKATGIKTSKDAAARIAAVAPNSTVTLFQNGAAVDMLDGMADYLGFAWFVLDGELHMLPPGAVIQDFAIILQQGRDLLDFSSSSGFDEIEGVTNMNARISPGRGILIIDEAGRPVGSPIGYSVQACRYQGDTHGPAFRTEFSAIEAFEPLPAPDVQGLTG
jgi:hypothetical protein